MLHNSAHRVRPLPPAAVARGVRNAAAVIAAAVTLLCVVGPGTSAAWTSSAALGSPVITAGAATPEVDGFSALTHVFTRTSLTTTAPVRLRNTGDLPAEFTTIVTLASDTSPALVDGIAVTIWEVADSGACTATATPVSAWTGRWDSIPTLTGRLAAGAEVSYCIRTTLERRNLANTVATVTPSLGVTFAVPDTQWRSTTGASATQSVGG